MRLVATGYTIVEVMIFLAISSVLLMSVFFLVGSQQAGVQFSQAMRDIDSRLKDTINDVGTGYYPNAFNFQCTVNEAIASNPLVFTPSGTDTSGKNKHCVFLGKVIQFGVDNVTTRFNVYTVLGRRQTPAGGGGLRETLNLSEARPTALPDSFGLTSKEDLGWGVKIKQPGNAPAMIGFFTTFGSVDGSGDLLSGSLGTRSQVIPVNAAGGNMTPVNVGTTQTAAETSIRDFLVTNWPAFTPVVLCFERADGDDTAQITIGASDSGATARSTDTKLEFIPC